MPIRTKLGPKTIDCVFIGFANATAAYRFIVYKSEVHDIHVNTILESIDVEFFEDVFPCNESRMSAMNKRTHDGPSTLKVQEQDIEPRRGSKIKKNQRILVQTVASPTLHGAHPGLSLPGATHP